MKKGSSDPHRMIILGTGTSTGVPIVGCKCRICQSDDLRNKRQRTSALIQSRSGKYILIDTGPDLRSQLLQHDIMHIDATVITHNHADHTHGIDDLRPYCFWQKRKIPVYTSDLTAKTLEEKFDYIFQADKLFSKKPILGGGIPRLELHEVPLDKEVMIAGEAFRFFLLPHGHTQTLCFIHDKIGYIVDCVEIYPEVLAEFARAKLDWLVIDCLRWQPHSTHLDVEKSLNYIKSIAPKQAGLIHLSHDLDHQELYDAVHERGFHQVRPLIDGETLNYGNL